MTRATSLDRAARRLGIELRPAQRRAAAALVDGRDVVVVLPTGAGKSAIFQAAGLARGALTLVVSPLRALQADQASGLDDAGVRAAALNSDLADGERAGLLAAVAAGEVEVLLAAPEQLGSDDLLEAVGGRVGLLAVDEAHCAVAWGMDFRPSYLSLGAVADALGRPPVAALTATAGPMTREDVAGFLGLHDPLEVVGDPVRANLHLAVEHRLDAAVARADLVAAVRKARGTGIVYVATTAEAEDLAADLDARRRPGVAFHGRLPAKRRAELVERYADGERMVVVATSAFGLGIDRPDVRFVHHLGPPETLEALYQEVGRAGRDDRPADATVFAPRSGGKRRAFAAGSAIVKPAVVMRALEAVRTGAASTVDDVARQLRCGPARAAQAAALLHAAGAARLDPDGSLVPVDGWDDELVLSAELDRWSARHRAARRADRLAVDRYLDGEGCRWSALAAHLGAAADPCGTCDRCRAGSVVEATAAAARWTPGSRVRHAGFGAGRVLQAVGDSLTILFDDAGERTLSSELVEQEGLLRPA